MKPNIQKNSSSFLLKECNRCKGTYGPESFTRTKSFFYPDGYLPICNDCIEKSLVEKEFSWRAVDKLCQYADIPFIPQKFEELHSANGNKVFPIYSDLFLSNEFEGLGWDDYFYEFKKLKKNNLIEDELPEIKEEKIRKLKEKWGANYDEEALKYLENLYNGLLMTQNVNGALQGDQALKVCKISYELDSRIRAGEDFDKMLTAYDKLVKTAEFTPKNVKNASNFDSTGELFRWLEKRGWKNKFYDGVTRDIVDETLKNIQNYNQRLYINESGIGDEITRRIEALKSAKELEATSSYYDTDKEYDLDEFDNQGYEDLFKEEEKEDFKVDLDDE